MANTIKFGTTDIADLKLGSSQVDKVYLGATQVWAKSAGDVDPDLSSTTYTPSVGSEASSVQYRGLNYPYAATDTGNQLILYAAELYAGEDPGNNLYYRYGGSVGWHTGNAVENAVLSSTHVETGVSTASQVRQTVNYDGDEYAAVGTAYGCYQYFADGSYLYYCYRPGSGFGNACTETGWYTDYSNASSKVTGVTA